MHPRREQVVHLGAARRVGIDVAGHVHAAGAGAVDHAQDAVHLAPVLAARGLHVGDLHRHPAPLADRDGFLGRLLERGRLAPDVREVEPAAARHAAGEPHQLVRVAVDAGRVHEPGGEAEGARVERFREQPLHALLLLRRHRARRGPDRGQPQRPVAHELHDVHRGAERPQVIEVLAEGVPGDGDLAADAARPLLHQIRAARGDRGRREAAHADHLGGHALAHLGLGRRTLVVDQVRVRVDVDEAGGDHQALGVDHPLRLAGQPRPHRRDAIALHRDVGGARGRAAAVHHRAVPDQERPGHGATGRLR